MKFIVTRTSTYSKKPCEECVLEDVHYKCDGEECVDQFYVIDFKSLEELTDFMDRCGHSVIVSFHKLFQMYEIEIYDEYRE